MHNLCNCVVGWSWMVTHWSAILNARNGLKKGMVLEQIIGEWSLAPVFLPILKLAGLLRMNSLLADLVPKRLYWAWSQALHSSLTGLTPLNGSILCWVFSLWVKATNFSSEGLQWSCGLRMLEHEWSLVHLHSRIKCIAFKNSRQLQNQAKN